MRNTHVLSLQNSVFRDGSRFSLLIASWCFPSRSKQVQNVRLHGNCRRIQSIETASSHFCVIVLFRDSKPDFGVLKSRQE